MKHLLLTTIAAVVLVGCGESQQSTPSPETKPVEPVAEVPARPSAPPVEAKPVEPVAEAASPEPPTAKAPDISIWDAAEDGNIEAVKQHLASGADVNVKDTNRWTPLHYAAWKGHKKIVVTLIAKGADVNAKNRYGTPLHLPAGSGHKDIAKLLIANGADVNVKDVGGDTPLDWAINRNHPEIADLLRKSGGKTSKELKATGK
jgi:hypothetical protein